jgi:membrane protein
MVDRITRMVAQVDAWSQRRRFTRVARNAIVGFLDHNALNYAGAMAYFAVLSLFQLLVLAVVIGSYFLGEGEARDFVVEMVAENTPLDPAFVGETIDAVIESRGTMSVISIAFLLWGALGLFSALSAGISIVFENAPRRDFIKDKLIGLLLMGLAGALALASLVVGIATGILQRMADRLLIDLAIGDTAVWLIGLVAPIALIFLAFWVVYKVVPNRPVTWGEVLPGAVAATALWTGLRFGFTWYATSIANYDSAFGPVSTGITLIIFLYFASVIVLVGAEFARARALDREAMPAGPIQGADPRYLPVAVEPLPAPAPPPQRPLLRPVLIAGAVVIGLIGVLVGRVTKRGDDEENQYL